MATPAHQYRGANTLHQAGVSDRMDSMRMQDANALPSPPSARPRAFPLAGSAKSRPAHEEPAFQFASDLDAVPVQDYANATLLPSINPRLAAMQPAPLFANSPFLAQRSIDAATKDTKPTVGAGTNGDRSSNGATANALASGSGVNTIDAASFHTSLEVRRSVCQSPSWEAYTQRKQDKKGAKKEKEQAIKQAKSKPRRLSKPPPPSPSLAPRSRRHTQSEQSISKTSTSRQQSRGRSNSALDLAEPPPIGSSSRAGRSRSSSFSSLIRSTFEIRRPSVDLSVDNGFIGGIKLEQHLVAAEEEQRKEEARQAKEEELGIHPALRSEKNSRRAGSSSTGPPTSTRSRYPPSTWRTSPSTASLVAPSAPQLPELSTLKKWRTRVGLKAKDNTLHNASENTLPVFTATDGYLQTSIPVARNLSPPLIAPARHSLDTPRDYPQTPDFAIELPAFENWPGPYTTSPPPPEPPQKSSKRKSVVSMDSPVSLKSTFGRLESADKNPNAYANVTARAAPRRASIDIAPSSPLASSGHRRSFKEAARAAFGKVPIRPSISVLPNGQTGGRSVSAAAGSPRQPESLRRAQTSSSEGSLSDEYHSTGSTTTSATTPDISRPQSEKGFFSIAPKIAASSDKKKSGARRSESSPGPASASRAATEDELDPIQAAAQKVRAAFPEAASRPMGVDRRAPSELSAQREVPRLRHPTLKSADRSKTRAPFNTDSLEDDDRAPDVRELILSKDQSSVAAPWPASYLEAARKAAPAAPIPRNKPTNFPSPSLSTLSGLTPPSPRSQIFSSGASDNSGGQSPVPTSASSFTGSGTAPTTASGSGNEPLAKMFVECCGCRYYHDMPSKLYEAMSNPEGALGGPGEFAHSSVLSMTVRCPWCQHDMSTRCCAGLVAMVYVKERLH